MALDSRLEALDFGILDMRVVVDERIAERGAEERVLTQGEDRLPQRRRQQGRLGLVGRVGARPGIEAPVGAVEPGDLRFPDMSAVYSPRLCAHLRAAASDAGVPVREGTYVGLLGPTYETPAEVRMLQRLGADVTGMSTVAEAIVAAALGIEFAAVSLVTNPAAGLSDTPIRHEDVTEAAARAARGFGDLLERFVARL